MDDKTLFALSLTGLILGVIGVLFACLALWHHPELRDDSHGGAGVFFNPSLLNRSITRASFSGLAVTSTTLPIAQATTPVAIERLPAPAAVAMATHYVDFHLSNVEITLNTTVTPLQKDDKTVGVRLADFGNYGVLFTEGLWLELRFRASDAATLVKLNVEPASATGILHVVAPSVWFHRVRMANDIISNDHVYLLASINPSQKLVAPDADAYTSSLQTLPASTKPVTIVFNQHRHMYGAILAS